MMGRRIADISFIKEAIRLVENGEAKIEFDMYHDEDYSNTEVSRSVDGRGAWVGAWVWVHFPEKEE
jgi:hypothetical protein